MNNTKYELLLLNDLLDEWSNSEGYLWLDLAPYAYFGNGQEVISVTVGMNQLVPFEIVRDVAYEAGVNNQYLVDDYNLEYEISIINTIFSIPFVVIEQPDIFNTAECHYNFEVGKIDAGIVLHITACR